MDTTTWTASTLAQMLDQRACSAREVTSKCLDRIQQRNPELNAAVHWEPEIALARAEASDQRRRSGRSRGPWDGVPILVKDIVCTRDMPTTCGSRMLQNYRPPYDAGLIERLEAQGLVLLGKANMDEFAMGGSTETGIAGPTRNPWNTQCTAGGSSGGSAAAVASGMVPCSIGSDTGGSIRQPAAYCGVCGLKPTYGRVSRYGLIAFASSLDQLGPMAHTVEDLAGLLGVIAGHDPRDSTSLKEPVADYRAAIQSPMENLKLGVIREQLEDPGLNPEIRSAIDEVLNVYRRAGATIVEVSLPHTRYGVPAYYIIAPCEASSNLSRYDGAHFGFRAPPAASVKSSPTPNNPSALMQMYLHSRSQGFGTEVKRRIMLGTYALSAGYYDAYYRKALQVRRLIRQDFDAALSQVDVLIGPTTPSTAFPLGEKVNDPVQMYLQDLFTVGANLAGLPALSIPCRNSRSGMPIGFQLQAAPLAEARLLQAGAWYQRLVDYQPRIH
jgi:aspartyl-tRNA(Asn)/glutamyl-tRNA(Gln) amidotransferase subunit A